MIRLQILWGDGRTAADSHDRSLPPVAARFPPTALKGSSSMRPLRARAADEERRESVTGDDGVERNHVRSRTRALMRIRGTERETTSTDVYPAGAGSRVAMSVGAAAIAMTTTNDSACMRRA
jgi:hypothetical protein